MVHVLNGVFFFPGSQFSVQQCGPVDEQVGTLCFSACSTFLELWFRQCQEFHEGESFSSQTLVAFYKHQIKVKIRSERERLSSVGFGKKWANAAHMYLVVSSSLEFFLEVAGWKNFAYVERQWQPSPGKLVYCFLAGVCKNWFNLACLFLLFFPLLILV